LLWLQRQQCHIDTIGAGMRDSHGANRRHSNVTGMRQIGAMGRTARYDRGAIDDLLARQNRVITRRQATSLAISDAALRHRLRQGGPWQILLPGVYLAATGSATRGQRELAALLYAGRGSVITGSAALAAHGIWIPEYSGVDVLIPAQRQRSGSGFARVHRTTRMPGVCHVVNGIRYAPPARAVADASRQLGDIGDVRMIVGTALQWRKVTVLNLAAELDQGPAAGSARLRAVLVETAEGVRSAAEAELRKLIKRAGLPDPLYNHDLYLGAEFIARPDAWWGDVGVAVEVDSKEWHMKPADWAATQARQSRMSALGIIVLPYAPSRLYKEPRVVMAELRSAIESGRGRKLREFRAVPAR
jgi:hypothetical protein